MSPCKPFALMYVAAAFAISWSVMLGVASAGSVRKRVRDQGSLMQVLIGVELWDGHVAWYDVLIFTSNATALPLTKLTSTAIIRRKRFTGHPPLVLVKTIRSISNGSCRMKLRSNQYNISASFTRTMPSICVLRSMFLATGYYLTHSNNEPSQATLDLF